MEPQLELALQLILATILGGLVGLEREYRKKEAGLRTYSLVSLGAAFFVIIAYQSAKTFIAQQIGLNFDPTRIISQIVLGVGFLGAGLIIFRGFHIEGLTTAAGLWVAAAIGTAIGVRLYSLALLATFLAIGILAGLRLIEEKFFDKKKIRP